MLVTLNATKSEAWCSLVELDFVLLSGFKINAFYLCLGSHAI